MIDGLFIIPLYKCHRGTQKKPQVESFRNSSGTGTGTGTCMWHSVASLNMWKCCLLFELLCIDTRIAEPVTHIIIFPKCCYAAFFVWVFVGQKNWPADLRLYTLHQTINTKHVHWTVDSVVVMWFDVLNHLPLSPCFMNLTHSLKTFHKARTDEMKIGLPLRTVL